VTSLIASLAALALRGSRWDTAYFVVARGRKACPLPPPHHGGARSGFDCSARCARSRRSRVEAAAFLTPSQPRALPGLLREAGCSIAQASGARSISDQNRRS
jgi:hypothetical protein